jgi:threonine dehydrogenase-like Zn-dependent dehydrogenase
MVGAETKIESSHPVTFSAKAFAARSASSPRRPFTLQRRNPRPQDIQIEILYCGVCHSDLHTVRDEWNAVMPTVYPCVPGHEIVGRVVRVGSAVKKFKAGDIHRAKSPSMNCSTPVRPVKRIQKAPFSRPCLKSISKNGQHASRTVPANKTAGISVEIVFMPQPTA